MGLLKSGEELKNQEEVDRRKKQSLMFSRDIIPKPDIRLFTEHFLSSPTVVGVSINLKRISYAKVFHVCNKFYEKISTWSLKFLMSFKKQRLCRIISWCLEIPLHPFMSRCSDFHI